MDSHSKFDVNVETDNATHTSRRHEKVYYHIMRLSGESKVAPKQLYKWLEKAGENPCARTLSLAAPLKHHKNPGVFWCSGGAARPRVPEHGLNFQQMPKEGSPALSHQLAQRWGRKGKKGRARLKSCQQPNIKEKEKEPDTSLQRPSIYINCSSSSYLDGGEKPFKHHLRYLSEPN